MAASANGGSEQEIDHTSSTDHREAKVFQAHAAPQRSCDNLINALKLQLRTIVTGLLERSRSKTMDGQ